MAQNFGPSMPTACKAITKSDSTNNTFNAIYVGGAGNVTITDPYGNVVEFVGVPAGQYIWCQCVKVMNATTATSLVGLT